MEKLAKMYRYSFREKHEKPSFGMGGAGVEVVASTSLEEGHRYQNITFVEAEPPKETTFREISVTASKELICHLIKIVYQQQKELNEVKMKISSIEESIIKKIEISSLGNEKLELRRNIPVHLEMDGDEVIAKFVDAEVTGFGESEYEALDSLKDNLISLYCELIEDEANLGPIPQKWLTVLREIIKEK